MWQGRFSIQLKNTKISKRGQMVRTFPAWESLKKNPEIFEFTEREPFNRKFPNSEGESQLFP